MSLASTYRMPFDDAAATMTRRVFPVGLISAAAVAAAFALSTAPAGGRAHGPRVQQPAIAATHAPDPYALVVDALLVPLLETDDAPPRWGDPRIASRCGRLSSVTVNGRAVISGERVPEGPFRLEWLANGCRHGADARIDGAVKMIVFREDWGYSAIVEPSGLRVEADGYEHAVVQRGAASLSRCAQPSGRLVRVPVSDGEVAPC